MRKIFWFVLLVSNAALAQRNMDFAGKLSGTVRDNFTKKPVAYAALFLSHLRDSNQNGGALADTAGNFLFENLSPGRYLLKVSFIGYKNFVSDTISINQRTPEKSLPSIVLEPLDRSLNGVEITGQKDQFVLGVDRKIFNVDKNLMAAGGSVMDVLKQVPTLQVDIDGKISLRGSENVIIFINGKPSGINASNRETILAQIPAANIERIELITNPSAKYDAEGMSGIINIVTKKAEGKGKNGSVTASAGTGKKYTLSGVWNYRSPKFSTTHNLGYRLNRHWMGGYSLRDDMYQQTLRGALNTYTSGYNQGNSLNASGSMDWVLKRDRTLSITYLMGGNIGNNPEGNRYNFYDSMRIKNRMYDRSTTQAKAGLNTDLGINYQKNWKPQKADLNLSGSYSYNGNGNVSNFTQTELGLDSVPNSVWNKVLEANTSASKVHVAVAQADYSKQYKKNNLKLEAGFKSTYRNFDSKLAADSFNYALNTSVKNNGISNHFTYQDNVNAVYISMQGIWRKWGWQAGVRAEDTRLKIYQEVGDSTSKNWYLNPFPTLHLTRKTTKAGEFQYSLSRRINRPDSRSLNPFAEYSDPKNLRKGNPYLKPELIWSTELSWQLQKKKYTLTTSVYFRQINQTIQRYLSLDSNGVSMVDMRNLDYGQNMGLELNGRFSPFKWWNLNGNINLFQSKLFGTTQEGELNAVNKSYNARLQSNMKFGKWGELQLSGNFNGPNVLLQGMMGSMYSTDAAYRYDFKKGKGTVTLNVSDLFDTRRMLFETRGINFVRDVYRKRESRIAILTFVYRFGRNTAKPDTEQKRRRNEENQGGGMDMGM